MNTTVGDTIVGLMTVSLLALTVLYIFATSPAESSLVNYTTFGAVGLMGLGSIYLLTMFSRGVDLGQY